MIKHSLTLAILLLLDQNISHATTPLNLTIINELRDFKPLYLGDNMDYFLSTKAATVEDAEQVCKSIGDKYHLVTLETDEEFRRLLPYLRSLEIPRVWTSGRKNSSDSMQWTEPSPSFPMNFINFPSSNMLAKLVQGPNKGFKPSKEKLPRCKNGFLTPKCDPTECDLSLEPCETHTPDCFITSCKPCTYTRPECSATCNNCVVEHPVCSVIQDPCEVKTKPCKVTRPPCKVVTPPCITSRPECTTAYPPCQITTPQPCTTTTPGPCTTTKQVCTTTTRSPCSKEDEKNGKCDSSPVITCKSVCNPDPEICFPGAIICPPPIITCPPEQTICFPPEVICPDPIINCPDPDVYCPPPRTQCTRPKVTCDAPEINCPAIVVNCPAPTLSCPGPIVNCPKPNVTCEDPVPCEYSTPAPLCPTETPEHFVDIDDYDTALLPEPSSDCDDCLPSGCIALRKDTDFKYKIEDCTQEFHFICEGTA